MSFPVQINGVCNLILSLIPASLAQPLSSLIIPAYPSSSLHIPTCTSSSPVIPIHCHLLPTFGYCIPGQTPLTQLPELGSWSLDFPMFSISRKLQNSNISNFWKLQTPTFSDISHSFMYFTFHLWLLSFLLFHVIVLAYVLRSLLCTWYNLVLLLSL